MIRYSVIEKSFSIILYVLVFSEISVPVEGVKGKRVDMPCDISPSRRDDSVYMVLWFRGDESIPIYRWVQWKQHYNLFANSFRFKKAYTHKFRTCVYCHIKWNINGWLHMPPPSSRISPTISNNLLVTWGKEEINMKQQEITCNWVKNNWISLTTKSSN